MDPSFWTSGDAMKETKGVDRVKYIHSVGNVGKVHFKSNGKHPYTGIFKGADTGLVRLSSAVEPSAQ